MYFINYTGVSKWQYIVVRDLYSSNELLHRLILMVLYPAGPFKSPIPPTGLYDVLWKHPIIIYDTLRNPPHPLQDCMMSFKILLFIRGITATYSETGWQLGFRKNGDVLRTQYTLYSFLKIITKWFTNLVAALDFSLVDPFENEKCIL